MNSIILTGNDIACYSDFLPTHHYKIELLILYDNCYGFNISGTREAVSNLVDINKFLIQITKIRMMGRQSLHTSDMIVNSIIEYYHNK